MFKHNKILAIFLLTVYGIVFGHSIVPHHHHYEDVCSEEQMIYSEVNHQHEGHIHSSSCSHSHNEHAYKHHQQDDHHNACDFEVTPLIYDGLSIVLVYLPSVIEEIRVPEVSVKTILPQYTPQKLPEGYDFAVPLRAPPCFS